jgi:exonuclease III
MILFTLNIKGVGGPLKSAYMCKLLNRTNHDIVFLQETLVDEKKARSFMNSLRPASLACVVS